MLIIQHIKARLKQESITAKADSSRFFKTDQGDYAKGERFIGTFMSNCQTNQKKIYN